MRTTTRAAGLVAAALLWAGAATAITLGQSDDFDGGSTNGWSSGVAHPAPPVGVPDGGPGGDGDGWLQLTALGGFGAGGKLVAFAGPQWLGDWLAAGVTAIRMDVRNAGPEDLELRLLLAGPGVSAISADAVVVAAGVDWTAVVFDLRPEALTGQPLLALADVQDLRLFHAAAPLYPGDPVQAVLGIDRVTAVPEPAPAALLAAGMLTLLAARRRAVRGANRRTT